MKILMYVVMFFSLRIEAQLLLPQGQKPPKINELWITPPQSFEEFSKFLDIKNIDQ